MALPDDEKLEIVRSAFKKKIMAQETWADFKTFLQGITQTQIKAFILTALQNAELKYDAQAAAHTLTADDIGELYTELDTDL
jgi:hypothetical protein